MSICWTKNFVNMFQHLKCNTW